MKKIYFVLILVLVMVVFVLLFSAATTPQCSCICGGTPATGYIFTPTPSPELVLPAATVTRIDAREWWEETVR